MQRAFFPLFIAPRANFRDFIAVSKRRAYLSNAEVGAVALPVHPIYRSPSIERVRDEKSERRRPRERASEQTSERLPLNSRHSALPFAGAAEAVCRRAGRPSISSFVRVSILDVCIYISTAICRYSMSNKSVRGLIIREMYFIEF